jgi:hypothetical protein
MTTDKVKAKIQELCPDVMELREGCQVAAGIHSLPHTIYGYDDEERVFMAYLNKPFPKDLQANSFYDCEFGIGAENVEILGSRITLAVVLRAMKKSNTVQYHWEEMVLDKPHSWNLEHDNYDQQSEECKQFIGSLLGV